MESCPCSAPPIQSRFLARNLSSLTRWRSCLCELVLRAVDGGGFLVRCRSISFATSPLAKSCFQKRISRGGRLDHFILIQGFCPLAPKSNSPPIPTNSPPIQNLCTHPSFRKQPSKDVGRFAYKSFRLQVDSPTLTSIRLHDLSCFANKFKL